MGLNQSNAARKVDADNRRMNGEFTIRQIIRLPDDFQELHKAGVEEGYRFLDRLKAEWESGENRFSEPGEAFFEARSDGELVGVCGLNRDLYMRRRGVGRLRRMYVTPAARCQGVGRLLVAKVLQHALGEFEVVRLRSNPDAVEFYQSLGFKPIDGDPEATHEFQIGRRRTA